MKKIDHFEIDDKDCFNDDYGDDNLIIDKRNSYNKEEVLYKKCYTSNNSIAFKQIYKSHMKRSDLGIFEFIMVDEETESF